MLLKNLYLRPGSVISAKLNIIKKLVDGVWVFKNAQIVIVYEVLGDFKDTYADYETPELAQEALLLLQQQNHLQTIPVS